MGLLATENSLPRRRQELKKHVATIHRSNALTLLQGKISNALLYNAYHELLKQEEHQITVGHLCKIIGYSGNNTAAIKTALKALVACVVEWNLIDQETHEEDWNASSVLASVQIKGPVCRYAYSPRMKALLHNPSVYGRVNMIVQARFRSSYGLALYENCVRYRDLPQTRWFELTLFRKLMGVSDDKYPIFRDFKRRILDKAIEEINTYSDLRVELELQRVGRQVAKLRFKISEREKKIMLGATTNQSQIPNNNPLLEKLIQQFKLSKSRAQQLISQYGPETITAKINLIEKAKTFQQGKISDISAYLIAALQHDYQPGQASGDVIQSQIRNKYTQVELTQHQARLQSEVQSKHKEGVQQKAWLEIEQTVKRLSPERQVEIQEAFAKYANNADNLLLHRAYQQHGLKSRIVRALYIDFIKLNFSQLLIL